MKQLGLLSDVNSNWIVFSVVCFRASFSIVALNLHSFMPSSFSVLFFFHVFTSFLWTCHPSIISAKVKDYLTDAVKSAQNELMRGTHVLEHDSTDGVKWMQRESTDEGKTHSVEWETDVPKFREQA